MASIQIITTYDQGPYAACEALWLELAQASLQQGHDAEVLLSDRAIVHPRVRQLVAHGARIRLRRSAPERRGFRNILHKVWERTGAGWVFARKLNPNPDVRILNVGTMVEVARDPWASLLEASKSPVAVIVHSNPEIRSYPPKLENRLSNLLTRATRVYFVSDRLRENAEEQLLTAIPGAQTVRNPVNLSSKKIEPWPDSDCLRLAMVGRLDSFVKGQIRLLHALSSDIWKNRAWELTIFGDGPDRDKIENAVDFYGLTKNVSFGGFVTDIRTSIWSSHHILVMPSMLEGMSLAMVEAMLCGRPALCSDVGGASELICDGVNGYLAGSPFARQIAQGLERVWSDKGRLYELGLIAHEDASRFVSESPGETLLKNLIGAIT